jgi:putative endopeptidase
MNTKKSVIIVATVLATSSCNLLKKKEVTTNKSTKDLSTVDISYMQPKVSPSEDFFQFSNGTWIANNPVPPSESRWGSFNELEQNNKEKLINILKSMVTEPDLAGSDAFILGNYFSSYTNMDIRNAQGFSPIQADVDKVRAMKNKSEIVPLIASQHIYGINSLFSFGVGQDLKNVNNHVTYVGQGGLSLPSKEYYLSENKASILKSYQEHIVALLTLSGFKKEEAMDMASNIVSFETKLAQAMMSPAELRVPEKTYNKLTLQETEQLFGNLDFNLYLNNIGSYNFDSIVVSQPDFLKTCNSLIEEESLETWKNYLTWKTIHHFAGSLSEEFVQEKFNFYGKVLSGKTEMKPIHERAIDEITAKDFGELLGKAFVQKHYSNEAQSRVNEMVDNLLIVFKERIESLDWMSNETKKEAVHKLNSIGRKLGFPEKWENYSELRFDPNDYVANKKRESEFSHVKNMRELLVPVDKKKWGMPAHMVNAYYHPLLNEIAFPAGIMQPPFFDQNAEDAVNYGRIGMVIGHEFTHGFDDMGSKFAADGSFKNWWTSSDRSAFDSKTAVLGETFSGFCPIEGHCVNANLTMGENIADLGGLTMAYHAYARTNEFKSGEARLGFTPAQRFFIAYAQLWKINYTEAEMKNRIANDSHSPGMYRVNGPLMNCPEFFAAFDVKEGQKMRNPKDKIARIW